MLLNETIDIQNKLAEYCKTGKETNIPGTIPERLHHYRRLIYNIVDDAMSTAFPITKEWLTPEEWDLMISDFLAKHPAQTPQVWKLPFEFYAFVKKSGYAGRFGKEALNDLLFFEWLEIEVHTMPDKPLPQLTKTGNIRNDLLVLNPHSKLITLEYPVHNQHADEASKNKRVWYILIFRDLNTDAVRFIQMSPLFAFVVEMLTEAPAGVKELIASISEATGINDEKTIQAGLLPFLEDMKNKTAIAGYVRETP